MPAAQSIVRSIGLALALALAAGPLAHGEEAAFTSALMKQHRLGEVVMSPDGRRGAIVVTEPPAGKERRSSIWLYEPATQEVRRLTAGKKDSQPRWSRDAATLAFIAKREADAPQVQLLPMSGGEAQALTGEPGGVSAFEWSPRQDVLAYLTVGGDAKPGEIEGDDEVVASQGYKPKRLKVIDVATRATRDLLPPDWGVGMFAWTPDGRHLVISATDTFKPEGVINRLFAVSVTDGSMRELGQMAGVEFGSLSVSPDGSAVAFLASGDGPMPHDLYVMPFAGGPARNLTGAGSAAAIDRPVANLVWTGPTTVAFTVQDSFGSRAHSVSIRTGRATELARFDSTAVDGWTTADARMVYAKSSAIAPAELWVREGGAERQVSRFHDSFPQLVAPRLIRYPAEDGTMIEAALFSPPGSAGPLPLAVLVHGGPTSRWSHAINDWAQLLVREGVAVLAPNIRGSTGYGHAFLKSNRADWGGGDFRDVMAGVDHLVAQGMADPERLGIGGWSYGGYMSAWAITQTQRFKAAVVGAAMLDLNTQWGAEEAEIVPYDTWYIGTPWDNPDNFRRMSPITHVKNVTTPTLLLVGEEDTVDPVTQNWQFFRALRMNGVKSELVLYPREGHRINEEQHLLDMQPRLVRWLVDHMKAAAD